MAKRLWQEQEEQAQRELALERIEARREKMVRLLGVFRRFPVHIEIRVGRLYVKIGR